MAIGLILTDSQLDRTSIRGRRRWTCACRTRVERSNAARRGGRRARNGHCAKIFCSHVLGERVANDFRVVDLARLDPVLFSDWSTFRVLASTVLPALIQARHRRHHERCLFPPRYIIYFLFIIRLLLYRHCFYYLSVIVAR